MDPQNPIDPASFLLPKKEAPAPAQRINAGALLEQEQNATLLKSELPQEKVLGSAPPQPDHFLEKVPTTPTLVSPATAVPKPKEERLEVSPLQTYRSDIEQVVHDGQGVSVVSIAAAEAARRGQEPIQETAEEKKAKWNSVAMIAGGVALVLLAGGVVAAIFLRPTTVPIADMPKAPFIFADNTALVPLPADQGTHDMLMTYVQAARQSVKLPVGLIEWLYVAWPAAQEGAAPAQLRASEFLQILAPNAPPELLRTLSANYLLGVHSFEENQPFLLLQVDSYELAYKAMLDWERTLNTDLLPLFSRNPSPKPQGAPAPASTTPQFIRTSFVDKVVENRDTRSYLNSSGDILLLWTFLGRNIILITTNEYTLREVLSRMSSAPVVPIPGR